MKSGMTLNYNHEYFYNGRKKGHICVFAFFFVSRVSHAQLSCFGYPEAATPAFVLSMTRFLLAFVPVEDWTAATELGKHPM